MTDDPTPELLFVLPTVRAAVPALLSQLRVLGTQASWDATTALGPYLHRATRNANVAFSRTLNPSLPGVILDDEAIQAVVTILELGDGESDSGPNSHLIRLIDRCTVPGTFKKVDPLKYIRDSLSRDALDAVRRHVGDPRIGTAFRRFVKDGKFDGLADAIEAFNRSHPGASLGSKRAATALLNQLDVFPTPKRYGLDPQEAVF